ncbi:TetR/AcrR family transcriptional regulator [Protaetiibacter larvae]|uniref:TetR/AcrR family transcriptional regulator n=1 Tax=Protaetiibacter larvae TaxID=2592654 RepID=A0A5C1Y563_9MICO|nr:TetR family transcriptional regulator [Protaetiibacter larvae]QEO08901.1 TetR/AcrR family transcriptional regulator [Protaetiibacter larvae]
MSRHPEPTGEPVAAVTRTQEGILSTYCELIEELGTDDVPYRVIALRAGVSERTVFRNFPARVHLLLAAADWIERTVFAGVEPESIFDVPLAIREAMEAYDRRSELAHVVAEAAMRGGSGAAPARRAPGFDRLLRLEVPSLTAEERWALVAALTHLDSPGTWVTMRRELGMSGRDIADAAMWAAEALLNPIRNRSSAEPPPAR